MAPAPSIATSTPAWAAWRLDPPSATPLDSTTFRNQAQLPRLPVPPLDVTLAKVLDSCRPLAKDASEFEALKKKVEEFSQQGGVGHVLQKRLEERREQQGLKSWIAEWWDTDAYMAYRDSVVVNVSYYYGFHRLPQAPQSSKTTDPRKADPAYVAASIVETALEFRSMLVNGELVPEPAGKEGGELCMESFKWAFNACRVPASPSDYAVKTAENAPEAQHMVVVRKNHFYSLPLVDEKGRRFTVEEFMRSFQEILDRDDAPAPGVGILTGINRDTWHFAHVHLLGSARNAETIASIHSSAFVLAFDDATPEPKLKPIAEGSKSLTSPGICDFSERIWKAGGAGFGEGEAANRWWDKPLQWIVFANGEAGFIGEHSCMDGTPTARLNDFLSKRLLTQKPSPIGASDPPPSASPAVKSLPFDLDDKSLKAIESAKKEFADHVGQYKVHYLHYGRYGKEGIKKMKTSPDGWTQMVFQLAYYMTHGHPCGTYEAAQVRRFQLGRTETVRICTDATVEFTKAMLDEGKSEKERRALFQKAIEGHGKDMKNASGGMGIDRHLFGLRHLVKEGESAPLLSDPLLARSSTWNMSTSQIFIENSPAYGWGPVVGDGYGLPYMIHTEHLQFTVTCHERMPGQKFTDNLGKAADLIMDMMEGAADAKL
ncbi:acyltransferase ChoActase/COT/CPT [Leucosporidium creatinivorum]|uniref:Acyltransferase ChoActase/COT/CPT n=1 Tax=Leucosporidium creatinivorum TaxID=106004 RepID=A0A1Y2CFY5_9BASI|nr:acyltransferase ChoActase/COT/CPT [Leucosporidium creatinivorum]